MKEQRDKNKELEKRLFEFSKEILSLAVKLPRTSSNRILSNQLVRAGTSVGANYLEACEAVSAKDFVHSIAISRKEARETIYWLALVNFINHRLKKDIERLDKECREFVRIFSAITAKFK